MKISKLYQLIGNDIVEIPLIDVEELNDRLLNIENNYLKLTGGTLIGDLMLVNKNIKLSELDVENTDITTHTIHHIKFLDGDNEYIGLVYAHITNKFNNGGIIINEKSSSMAFAVKVPGSNPVQQCFAGLTASSSGKSVFYIPEPSLNSYSTSATTSRFVKNVCYQKLTTDTTIHINYNTGSDTADLNLGRGLSSDKPFKTLRAATDWATYNLEGRICVTFMLHSDTTEINMMTWCHPFHSIIITSDSTIRMITMNDAFKIFSGFVILSNLNFTFKNANNDAFHINGGWRGSSPTLVFKDNIGIYGTALVTADCMQNGFITVSSNCTLTGDITARRYYCSSFGKIYSGGKGTNAFPGTIAGGCDESSVYI